MSEPRKLALIGTCKECKKEFIEHITTETGMHTITCECGETIEANLDELTAVDMASDHPRLTDCIIPEHKSLDPSTRSKRSALLAAGMGAMAAFGPGMGDILGGTMFATRYREPKKPRPCLNCKTPHTHNNAFCSATCCKEHKAKKS